MASGDYSAELQAKLDALAAKPGCYLFKDSGGGVLYVGKAKSLRGRVRSYFSARPSDDRYFIPILQRIVRDLDTVVTATEKEAAILENELIKRHQPRFNVKLRDDKDFLCLRLDLRKPWPRLQTVRRPAADGARYFGPYHSATAARRILRLVNKHFQLRTCSDAELRRRSRPCLQYQIKRCPGPCVFDADPERYAEQVRAVGLFLDGRHDELTAVLEERMAEAAAGLEYELAALYRDQLHAVESIRQTQRVVSLRKIDQDIVGMHRAEGFVELVVLLVRQGRVVDSRSLSLGRSELPDEELIGGFLTRYYGEVVRAEALPDELVLPTRPEAAQGLADWLAERRGKKVKVLVPRSGARAELLKLAVENAEQAFSNKRRIRGDLESRLEQLQSKLRLAAVPQVIECCDISHLGGGDATGAIVCMRDGELDRGRYRSFRIRSTDRGDDYAAIYEVLARRFRRGRDGADDRAGADTAAGGDEQSGRAPSMVLSATESAWELPDLLVVDGGRGQLSVALAAAGDLGLHDLAMVSLAKERESATGERLVERIYLPGQKNGIPITPRQPALTLLVQLRDEAHRFANRGREQAGTRRRLRSSLSDIAGIGPATEKALLRALGSLDAVRSATDEAILAVEGVSKAHLRALRKVHPEPVLRAGVPAGETEGEP